MKHKEVKSGLTLERAKQIIVNSDPLLSKEIVDGYTICEIKEWCKMLNLKTNF